MVLRGPVGEVSRRRRMAQVGPQFPSLADDRLKASMLCESPAFYECAFVFAGTTWEPFLSVTSCSERGVCFPSLLPPRPSVKTSFHHLPLAFEGRARRSKHSWQASLGGGDSHTLLKGSKMSKMFFIRAFSWGKSKSPPFGEVPCFGKVTREQQRSKETPTFSPILFLRATSTSFLSFTI